MRRTAELHRAATRHEESVWRDDAVHVSILCPVSVSRETPQEHRSDRDEIGSCPTRRRTRLRPRSSGLHLVMFEQPQTVTTTPMSGRELDTHSIYSVTVAGHRMSYHEYVSGAYYGLKYRAPQKRYLVMHLGLRLLVCVSSRLVSIVPRNAPTSTSFHVSEECRPVRRERVL